MSKRFNKSELYELRNFIPIETLIENELMIPSKRTTSGFKFQCIVCNEFQTAINPRTNLARCFRCERNFNPIDITMISKKIDFVQTVNYLKAYRKRIHKKPDTCTQNLSVPLSIKEILMNMGTK
ncbi:MAG: DnaG11 [Candidatus Magnetoglobus multicellularis str. Araruama]|uniref:DnaG11 n=1 Tax=Candidatus Magnetoglobus multicellularis str. Araruama TaxID=890399 RepID=A0A1V1P6Y7_9BACT|nr:MAG: DnaG11 [Candidatus Magnetoglobus multicellularis str. Araruama]